MNKRTVNISSLVLLLSLLSLITTMCLYYIVPMHYVSVIFAAAASVLLAHFFLESSLNYDYNFLHAASMTVTTLIFAIVIYLIQPNEWITFDFWLPCLVLINWLVPFLYCTLRDLFDRGPRFDGYHKFFNRMCIFFTFIYIFVILYCTYRSALSQTCLWRTQFCAFYGNGRLYRTDFKSGKASL